MALSTYADHNNDCLSNFNLTITLTKKGLANTDKVLNAVFKYIQRLKEVGPQQWVFEEAKKIGNISFDFAEKGDGMDYAVNLSSAMPHFTTPQDMEQVIRHSYTSDEYKPELLSQIVDLLADPQKCIVLLSSKSFEDDSLPLTQKWYKFNYNLEKFSQERLSELGAATVPDNGKPLDLPKPNNLIAENFDLLPEDKSFSAQPQCIQRWEGLADLWYKKDDKFKKPKGIIACKIYTSDLELGVTPLTSVFAEVWKRVL